jgi:hypothetical protein
MSLHRGFAGVELRRDLFVQQTGHDERHDLTLTLRQRFVPPSPLGQTSPLISSSAVTLDRLLNGVEELLVTKRFREKVHRAGLQRLHRHWNVPMSADEHDGDWSIGFGKLVLKVEATQSRESHVQDKAARGVGPLASQEFLGGLKRLRSEAYRFEEPREGFTHEWIIVDDVYG